MTEPLLSTPKTTTILIVEDSPTQLEELRFLLEEAGFSVVAATNGREGLEAAATNAIDLAVSDIVMPELDGYAFCQALRADVNLRQVPVILLTALATPEDVLLGLECGANGFISKPYDGEFLLAQVHRALASDGLPRDTDDGYKHSVWYAGQTHEIHADSHRVLELLLSTYANALRQNAELIRTREELRMLNQELEARVAKRTVDLLAEIGERERVEREREELHAQLLTSQSAEALGRFAGGIAHDFNNLLSVILGYTGFALEEVLEGDPLRENLLEVERAAERAAILTQQLLAFGRRQVLQPVPLDLNAATSAAGGMLRRIIGEDVDLVEKLVPDLWVVLVDPGQIDQVILNLAVNARDAMPGGGTLTLETANVELDEVQAAQHGAVKPGSYVRLAITDTGSGMDEQTQARIFEPYFTTKEKGKGTGLGLSTVFGIVTQSGGHILVQSEPGNGTTVGVYLPRAESVTIVGAERPVESTPTKGTETILVVEDEDAVRDFVARTLRADGYTVLTGASGADALATCETHRDPIHLVVADVVMPGMGGPELGRRLAIVRPEAKILYMSGYPDPALIDTGAIGPATAFIGKPFTAVGLKRLVRRILSE
jgi:signal transduction histidine kinase